MTEDILSDLNPGQKEAVTWGNTPLLILAGAGSGKTRILTRRMAYLVSKGIPAFQILGVTFTNKAAQEMKLRVQKLVKQDVWISTFHSTCLKILRMDGPIMGVARNFTMYDEYDQLVLIRECIRELNLNEKQIHPKGVRERIQRAKDVLMTPAQYAEKSPDLYEETVAKVYAKYESKLDFLKACDFGDLIMKTVLLFERHETVLRSWQDRFQHILIDEYQDTNHAQYRLVNLLASSKRQITVVGDPDQSIYAWRGADIRNILNFEKDYPECGMIRMEQNYRSTAVILDAANELIKRNQLRKPKALWTEREGGDKISLVECEDEKREAEYVVREIIRAKDEGIPLAEQVIFYRVHAQSRVIEDMLRRVNMPYKIVGGVRFYDRLEIKDIVAYLRVIANPSDDVSMKRIINVPARGVGKKALEAIELFAADRKWSIDETIAHIEEVPGITPKAQKSLKQFSGLLKMLRKERDDLSLIDLLEKVLERTRYVEVLKEQKSVEAEARIENIEEFFSVIEDFEETYEPETTSLKVEGKPLEAEPLTGLDAFLESISLVTNLDKWDQGTNVLTLMTLHTAKGLEFPNVYMVGLEEGIFPNGNSYTDDPEDIEEERRLCYVGITRAKNKLTMTYATSRRLYGSMQHNLPSRFLNEIPSECLQASSTSYRPNFRTELSDDVILEHDIDVDIDADADDDGETRRRILFD